jgi:hypothetical protein
MQVSERYTDVQEYLESFLLPVALASLRLLTPKGVLCLNISDNPKRGVEICKPFLRRMSELMPNRFGLLGTFCYATGTNPGNTLPRNSRHIKGEPIYVFCQRIHMDSLQCDIERYLKNEGHGDSDCSDCDTDES